jgi:hypothetical protein
MSWKRMGEWTYSSTHSLTSALDGGEWSASRPGRFTPKERAPGTHWIGGWMGPRAVVEAVVKRKIPSPRRESNPRTPIVQSVAQRYTDWAITALHSCWYTRSLILLQVSLQETCCLLSHRSANSEVAVRSPASRMRSLYHFCISKRNLATSEWLRLEVSIKTSESRTARPVNRTYIRHITMKRLYYRLFLKHLKYISYLFTIMITLSGSLPSQAAVVGNDLHM